MAKDKRLIDADKLLEKIQFRIEPCGVIGATVKDMVEKTREIILAEPEVDAVEVVRCKDCVYNENGCCTHSEYYDDTRYRPDYFCADGERKDNERKAD